jgi:transposase InsO family protein
MRFSFIEAHRPMWRLKAMCRALRVSKAGYFAWRHSPQSAIDERDRPLLVHLKALHARHRGVYGSPRLQRELRSHGIRISRKHVARLMHQAGISGTPLRRFVVTTDSNHDRPIARNVLAQDFSATAANQRWVTDITYVATAEGWLFVAAIMDLYSRRIIGWAMNTTMTAKLVLDALAMAVDNRRPSPGLIHHSDRGSQYASDEYRSSLAGLGITASMSRRACCYDNAAMESFWATLKRELVHRTTFATRVDAREKIFEYIEVFYNRERLHSTLGYVTPETFEGRDNAR